MPSRNTVSMPLPQFIIFAIVTLLFGTIIGITIAQLAIF
jgi:hypothetical protein